ncbi:Bifunctional hemolysin/adenylate cyclase precursor [Planctomycetes bacterium MalM25]|nr:Bifunctional hemolysin/adenylate cyclase precursor [Planctomycetes bacterium MalM25]
MSTFKKNDRNAPTARQRFDARRLSRLQRLEDRRVLSITPPILIAAEGRLVVTGGDLDDTVVVSKSPEDSTIVVQQYEQDERLTSTFPQGSITSVHLVGNGGDDQLINRTDIATFAEGGAGNDTLVGGTAADRLSGGSGNDRLEGREGDDTLLGGGGEDSLLGEEGADRLEGGDDDDLLYGDLGDDQLYGEAGNDRLDGNAGEDYLNGGDGEDILLGGSENDFLNGEAGDDRLIGHNGNDTLLGGDGEDTLFGEAGEDQLDGGRDTDTLYGGADDDVLYGRSGADQLFGEAGEDYLNGGSENDRLLGGVGDDFLNGAEGADRLEGRDGNDTLLGGDGEDTLLGDAGVDHLDGGRDKDTLYGGADDDRLYGRSGADQLYGEQGEDYLNGGDDNDQLFGGSEDDFLNGEDGDDRLVGHEGDDTLLGGDGEDSLFGDAGKDSLDGGRDNDTLYGGAEDDLLYGRSGADQLFGETGADYVNGGADDDFLVGGDGDDFLNGEDGVDRLEGREGNDSLLGGDGEDSLLGDAGADHLDGGRDNDTLYGGAEGDRMYGRSGEDLLYGEAGGDYLNGGADDDRLFGGDGDDFLYGESGQDRMEGQRGDDVLFGGEDDDVLHGDADNDLLKGGDGDDTLYGDDGDDTVYGDAGRDWISGAAGNDDLLGGADDDRLFGGAGNDALSGGSGEDRLEGDGGADVLLGGDDADSLVSGDGNDIAIGGGGGDTLEGSEGEDILIGSTTAYDDQFATLREALARWNSGLSYEERVAQLSASHADITLIPHETVFADLVADTLVGGSGQDWFIISAINGTYNPLGVSHEHHDMGMHHASHHHSQAILLHHPPALEGHALIDSIDHLSDAKSTEMVQSRLAHHGDPSKLGEHFRLLQLVRYADVTHTAVTSGAWSDPNTWEGSQVPTTGARVLIPLGAQVTIDAVLQAEPHSIRVDGTLSFATDRDSELRVDTVVVTEMGALHMGTAETPVQSGVTAKLLFTDNGPIDRVADPFALGRGLITHGQVRLHGAAVTPFAAAIGGLRAGDTTLRLENAPTGWAVGDRVAIAGTDPGGSQTELREILAINGGEITIAPLEHDHVPLEAGLEVHVSNLDRNVVLESAATVNSRRGHVMFMHNRDIHISYTAFNGLGRTDKSFTLTDPEVDENWNLIGSADDNPRARYAVHFHRNGVKEDTAPATVHGSVVDGSPGWGYVNHSSYIEFTDNVAYGVNGAAFVAEAGDEIGVFDGNLALNTTGTDADVDSRFGAQDFGFNGDGFWFQSPGVSVTNNIASGSTGSAFMYYTRGLRVGGQQIVFLAENLEDSSLAGGEETILPNSAPIKEFNGNIGYASKAGLTVRYNLREAQHNATSLLSHSIFWNNETGVDLPYARNTVLRNLVVLIDPAFDALNGVDNNAQTRSVTFNNLRVEGYKRGIVVPTQGTNVVEGGYYLSKNAGLMINPADSGGLQVLVTGNPVFGAAGASSPKDIVMNFQTDNDARNPNQVFYSMDVRLQYGPYTDHRLFFHQQHADAVPFPVAVDRLPSAYVGLTQAELADQFGIAIAGEIAPDDAQTVPDIYGLLAPASGS